MSASHIDENIVTLLLCMQFDLKSPNVLLAQDLTAKIADVSHLKIPAPCCLDHSQLCFAVKGCLDRPTVKKMICRPALSKQAPVSPSPAA